MRNLFILVILYLLVGVGINFAQEQNGAKCDTEDGEIFEVDVDEPKGLLKYVYWAPNLYTQVFDRQVPWQEYFSPTSCVQDPNPEPDVVD
jgi:hypothetical protein